MVAMRADARRSAEWLEAPADSGAPAPVLRTPDDRFACLPGFDFAPRYAQLGALRIHYVDEGPRDADELILCLHGAPTWSYVYRKMIPPLARRARVVAPDLVGFGRSDKYARRGDYSLGMHYRTLSTFVDRLDLRGVTLVVQDWGGVVGLPYAARNPGRVRRLVIMNTGLPGRGQLYSPSWSHAKRAVMFLAWRAFTRLHPDLPIGRLIAAATVSRVAPDVLAAYEAPFPDRRFKVGAAVSPALIPLFPWSPGAAALREAETRLREWRQPALIAFSDGDPFTRCEVAYFRALIPAARARPPITIAGAGHLLQEDRGEEVAGEIERFMVTSAGE
jgi:haloalkane dehalogenase